MKNQSTIAEQIKDAAARQDLYGLKKLREQLGQDKWLKAWRDNGSKMEDWIGPTDFEK